MSAPPKRTHCKRGHAFIDGNIIVDNAGDRHCRECNRINSAAWRADRVKQNNKAGYLRLIRGAA